ncbi:portal protein [Allopusillimonas ginsengisoli]|uniref:portal protein n=1 Tax=Allopusillimonas ginsengisoli TaxID=453575 RepID=UPI001021EC69|nr:hypothetical protein [Allopusillimonas ginsengisoli]TEA78648.1 hypothetical protein ERE07_09640 [Allopusillimonas ginsengisoli]
MIDEDDFARILDSAITDAEHWQTEHLSADRERNYRYYLGQAEPALEGRSQAVSWDVFETIESAMPDLIEIFLSGENIAEYEPVGVEDEPFAGQATDYINYIVSKQNPGFLIFSTWIKDALLSKIGIVRAYWAENESVVDRRYTGLNELQLTQLLQDDSIEVVEQSAKDDPADIAAREQAQSAINTLDPEVQQQVMAQLAMPVAQVFDVKLRKTQKKGRVYIDNVQPENFIITPRAKTIAAADIVGEFKMMTRSDMIEAGYKRSLVENVQSFETAADDEGIAQIANEDAVSGWPDTDPTDDSTEEIRVFDGFIRLDYDGDGLAEWRKVVRAANVMLLNEEVDCPDFCTISPILIPHRLVGVGLADTVAPIQETSTAMQRQYVDSLMLANNPRTYVNVDAHVNLDDLLNNRVGGMVRGKGPMQNAVSPLVTTNVAQSALEGIEFMDSRRENRTGITRYNQGLDADSLNKTATGVTKIMSAGDARKRMMARIMAETGIKDLFRLLLKIVTNNQDKAATVRLRGEWVEFDPSQWSPEMDVTIETGRGSGDKSQTIGIMQMVLEVQKEALMSGSSLADEQKIYNTLDSLLKAAGIKGIDKYFNNPEKQPPQEAKPPEPSPEEAIARATVEAEQIKAGVKEKEIQADLEMKGMELRMKEIELEIRRDELALKRSEAEHDAQMSEREQQRKEYETLRPQPIGA